MAGWFAATPQMVALDYAGNLRTQGATGVAMAAISQADLDAEATRISNTPISWIDNLFD